MNKFFSILLISILLPVFGCSSVPVDEKDPASLFRDAEAEIESDHYLIAIEKLRAIKNKFPYSSFAADSQLRIADVYYLQELFVEAVANYQAFRDLHPKHPKGSYALFQIGKSYFRDAPTMAERDLTLLSKALETYMEFLSLYPNASEAPAVRKDVLEVRNRLSEKELLIGDFYFKTDFFQAAKPRYEKVIQYFPDTESARLAEEKLEILRKKIEAAEEIKTHGLPNNK